MNINEIRAKLPEDLAKRITDEKLLIKEWSDEWYKEAKEIIYELNINRDNGIITKEEYNFIFDRYFRKWGIGIIGENPNTSLYHLLF